MLTFSVLCGDMSEYIMEAEGWAEVAKEAEITFGRLNVRAIFLRRLDDDNKSEALKRKEQISPKKIREKAHQILVKALEIDDK